MTRGEGTHLRIALARVSDDRLDELKVIVAQVVQPERIRGLRHVSEPGDSCAHSGTARPLDKYVSLAQRYATGTHTRTHAHTHTYASLIETALYVCSHVDVRD